MFAHDIPPSEVRRHEHAPYLPGLVHLTMALERLADAAERAEAEAEAGGAGTRGMYGFPVALSADGRDED